MKELKVNLGERSYKIIIGSGNLQDAGKRVSQAARSKRAVIVTNPTVAKHYLDPLEKSLERAEFTVSVVKIPDGEQYKTLETVETVYNRMVDERVDRSALLIALGGGVVGDLAGFVAATYMRGIDFVQVPTTLLAQVDSSVGGKVGVNLKKGKNLVGAFYQPKLVVIDTAVLGTLPARELKAGIAEVIKYGIIWEKGFFAFVERNLEKLMRLDPAVLEKVIGVSCSIKAQVVEEDERERGLRAILNFGHTVGHAIEAVTAYKKYLHGEAISIGMACAARIALKLGMLDKETLFRIENLLCRAGLPVKAEKLNEDQVIKHLSLDKKVKSGKLHFVMPHEIGRVTISEEVPESLIRNVLKEIGA